ncbi:vWA domain-containing protein [Nocardioides speluncae]|uniref:vWA domain-containing protein n=1 Tax=Nocardioides speluncae TaxID=2670337 RepID=UPI000D69868A|nr:VWA domain-containing protein [Nocardioides speluncae]
MSGLLDRHIGFVEALREAGLAVSLAEDLDALTALQSVTWDSREVVRTAYAATLVKRQAQRPTFDSLFDLWFPRLVGDGAATDAAEADEDSDAGTVRDSGEALQEFRDELLEALITNEEDRLRQLAGEAVGRFGAMPGRAEGESSWSSYAAMKRVDPDGLVFALMQALLASGEGDEESARATANGRAEAFTRLAEGDARRRIAEQKGPEHVARIAVRPTIDRIDFINARRGELADMRREIYPLARRLATRLTQEHHARRRGPLDFRRTVRASISTGGVPLTTHHKPKRPHRTELVVLCDVSGSVANFAQFTLLLVFALREQFAGMRAFTFVDTVHEVTSYFRPGADPVDVLADLGASASQAALWGRTNYGRAFTKFQDEYAAALGPKSSLLILGDARSNYSDLALPALREMADSARHAWWLNPESSRQWGTGDSAAREYAELVPMVECRNLTQLAEFVHDIL